MRAFLACGLALCASAAHLSDDIYPLCWIPPSNHSCAGILFRSVEGSAVVSRFEATLVPQPCPTNERTTYSHFRSSDAQQNVGEELRTPSGCVQLACGGLGQALCPIGFPCCGDAQCPLGSICAKNGRCAGNAYFLGFLLLLESCDTCVFNCFRTCRQLTCLCRPRLWTSGWFWKASLWNHT